MTRGSVPLHWSQPGYKYRPPPRLDKSFEEDKEAFERHFQREFQFYGKPVTCISLVEKNGREKVIADSFFDHAIALDSEDLGFVAFDFHEACKGMHFENVSILLEGIHDLIRAMK